MIACTHTAKIGREGSLCPDCVDVVQRNIDKLQQWIDDLQSGMYINCSYCGFRFGPAEEDQVPETMREHLKKHMIQCEEHPMHGALEIVRSIAQDLPMDQVTWLYGIRDQARMFLGEIDGIPQDDPSS